MFILDYFSCCLKIATQHFHLFVPQATPRLFTAFFFHFNKSENFFLLLLNILSLTHARIRVQMRKKFCSEIFQKYACFESELCQHKGYEHAVWILFLNKIIKIISWASSIFLYALKMRFCQRFFPNFFLENFLVANSTQECRRKRKKLLKSAQR